MGQIRLLNFLSPKTFWFSSPLFISNWTVFLGFFSCDYNTHHFLNIYISATKLANLFVLLHFIWWLTLFSPFYKWGNQGLERRLAWSQIVHWRQIGIRSVDCQDCSEFTVHARSLFLLSLESSALQISYYCWSSKNHSEIHTVLCKFIIFMTLN